VSDIEDDNLLDVDAAGVPNKNAETPNTFGRNLLRVHPMAIRRQRPPAPYPFLKIQMYNIYAVTRIVCGGKSLLVLKCIPQSN